MGEHLLSKAISSLCMHFLFIFFLLIVLLSFFFLFSGYYYSKGRFLSPDIHFQK